MRTTVTINDKLYKALKLRAVETDSSVSSLIEDAIKFQILEDFEDIQTAKKRANQDEFLFEDLVKQYKAENIL